VVGGGPSGMEAALAASKLGHNVTLFEATDSLGGQLSAIPLLGLRRELGALRDFLPRAIQSADIDIRLGATADSDTILNLEPHAVIIATGSTLGEGPPAGFGESISGYSILTGSAKV